MFLLVARIEVRHCLIVNSLEFCQFNRVEEVYADVSKVHQKYIYGFGYSAKTFLDFGFTSQFVREGFIFKSSGVVDGHWNKDGFLNLFVEVGVSDDVLESELRR